MKNIWLMRFDKVMGVFSELKSMTKQVPASQWTPEYKALAEAIHTAGRNYFHVGIVQDMQAIGHVPKSPDMIRAVDDPKLFEPMSDLDAAFVKWEGEGTPLARAYKALGKILSQFQNCLLCGRGMPGHHAPDCQYLLVYDDVRREEELNAPKATPSEGSLCTEDGCGHKLASHFSCVIGSFCKECDSQTFQWEHGFKL